MEEQGNIQESKLLLHMNDDPDNGDASGNVNSKFVYLTTFISAFSLFTLGYDTGVISGSMVLITEQFSLSYIWQELLVSLAIGPAVIGTFFGGYFNEVIGRKSTLLVSSIMFSIGALVMGCAPSKEILLVGRIVTGVAIGFTCVTASLYIAEAAPARIRGKLISVGALFITGSQFLAAVTSGIFSGNKENGWRYMLGLGVVPSLVFCAAVLMVPESPRWFISKGRMEEATKTLQRLRGIENVEEEINEIKRRHKMSKQEGSTWTILFKMVQESSTRKALLVACLVMAIQQLSGINTVMYYTATIIKMAGVTDDQKAIWFAAAVAFTNFLFTFVGFFLIERIGRRKLILSSMGGVILCLILLAVAFHLKVEYSPAVTMRSSMYLPNDPCSLLETCDQCLHNELCGFCYLDDGESFWNTSCVYITNMTGVCNTEHHNFQLINQSCPSSVAWLAVLGMAMYLVCFAPGLGPVPFVVASEIFPLWARTTGFACAVATYFFTNLVISMTFLHVSELLTTAGWFVLSAGFSLLGWVFIYFVVPETKGRPLEHMQELFRVDEPE